VFVRIAAWLPRTRHFFCGPITPGDSIPRHGAGGGNEGETKSMIQEENEKKQKKETKERNRKKPTITANVRLPGETSETTEL